MTPINVPPMVAQTVDFRDSQRCVRCGVSLFTIAGSRHHRERRRDGGHTVENLILLCGSGTTECHGWVHRNPVKARACGYIVTALGRATPADIPVLVHAPGLEPFQSHVWMLLLPSGTRHHISHKEAMVVFDEFGIEFPTGDAA